MSSRSCETWSVRTLSSEASGFGWGDPHSVPAFPGDLRDTTTTEGQADPLDGRNQRLLAGPEHD